MKHVAMIEGWPPVYNGSNERCDMLLGPCCCGATHTESDLWDMVGTMLLDLNARIGELEEANESKIE